MRCTARGDGPARGRCTLPAGGRHGGGGGGTLFSSIRPFHHGNVAVCASVPARFHGAAPARPLSMRHRARHYPKSQGVARTCMKTYFVTNDQGPLPRQEHK